MHYHLAKADTLCIALREILTRRNSDDQFDRASFRLVCEIFEEVGELELLRQEAHAALWPPE